MNPEDIDLSNDLRETFGCAEFEQAAVAILRYLADDSRRAAIDANYPAASATGWDKPFRIDTIEGIDPVMFAMLCASGWIANAWFPKGSFVVSDAFIERLGAERLTGRKL